MLAGKKAPEDVTLRAWAQIKDEALDSYGDGVLGIYQNTVVTAFDVVDWERQADGRVVFNGVPSAKFGHLIGTPNPGRPWVQGQARPVQYLDTAVLTGGTATVEDTGEGRRAVINDFILTVGDDGSATLAVPAGQRVTVLTSSD
ncbi:hypothetical protein FNV62_06700 [Streptomyces sp. RLB3-17]|uniref:hypothetical protein n=1 Tax=Streptomyces sp. RLB3-17 TaxID=2594455 RepID=UPI00116301B0|nr:hypothetical protein [Streptomyces sp. RLB3-17]QDO37899.1 hypothetical protein FNV62_06700 [Streptomyces sp. RLB3-17]